MAFTLNRRLAQLVDSNGQLNTGKIPNDYITSDHIADNTITSAMLHTSFTVSASNLGTTLTPTFGNITTTGYIAGPATFTIDPAAVGDNTGTVVIAGNLQVDGTTTTINSTTMTVDDLNITLASGAANAAAANGAGITVDGASATFTYDGTNDQWDFNKDISISGNAEIVRSAPMLDLMEDGVTDSNHRFRQNAGNLYIQKLSDDKATATDRIVLDGGTGNVGIGTSSPNTLLTMQDDSTVDGSLLTFKNQYRVSTTTADTMGGIAFSAWRDVSSSASYCAAIYAENTGYPGTSGNLIFATRTNGNTDPYDVAERMRIDPSGNVGIGGSPTNYSDHKTLSLYGNTGTGAGFIEFNDTSGNADAVIFSDNGNLFINADYDNTTADSSIRFRVDGSSEKMRIDSLGNIGIGVTPDTLSSGYTGLQINGYAYLIGHSGGDHYMTNNAYFNSGWKYGQTSTAQKVELASGRITLMTAASGSADSAITWNTGLVQDSSGNVGIGTSSPFSKLSINSNGAPTTSTGNMASTGLTVHNGTGGTAVQLGTYDAGSWGYIQSGYVNNATVAREFRIMNGANYTMTLSNTGNVGIGTESPLSNNKLHVNGNVHIGNGADYSSYAKLAIYDSVYQGDVALLIKNDRYNDSTATASLIFEHRTHAGQGHAAKIICRRQSSYNESAGSKDAALDFYTANGGTLARHMVINRSGQFGVGNDDTFDAYAHHVIQSDTTQKVLDIKQNNSTGRVLGLQYIPNGPDDTTDYYMVCSDSNTNDMFIYSNGNVANKNNSYGSSSDIKIKQNISDANSQWNDIKALQFKNYKLKTDVAKYGEDNADTLLGLIAQDVETEGMNGLVYESKDEDSDGNDLGTVTKGIKYSVLYLKAVKALQEAIVKIEDLESRITELEG